MLYKYYRCSSCRTRRCREPTKKFDGGRRRNGEFVIALMKQSLDWASMNNWAFLFSTKKADYVMVRFILISGWFS